MKRGEKTKGGEILKQETRSGIGGSGRGERDRKLNNWVARANLKHPSHHGLRVQKCHDFWAMDELSEMSVSQSRQLEKQPAEDSKAHSGFPDRIMVTAETPAEEPSQHPAGFELSVKELLIAFGRAQAFKDGRRLPLSRHSGEYRSSLVMGRFTS